MSNASSEKAACCPCHVDTIRGRRVFQTEADEWPDQLPDGSVLIRHVAGDLYRIPSVDALDTHSRKLLWPYVD